MRNEHFPRPPVFYICSFMEHEISSPESAAALTRSSTDHPTGQSGEDTQHCRRVLLNLVDIGNEIAEILGEEVRSHKYNPAPGPSPVPAAAAAYATVAQSVRRTIMLHDKLGQPRKSHPNRTAARKRIIRDVEDAIEHNAPEDEQETLHAELLERLDRPDLEDEIADRSVADVVTDITRDLGISGRDDSHRCKRRIPHDIAILNARAEQLAGAGPSEKLLALLASAPPPPPRRITPLTAMEVSKMSDEEIEFRLKRYGKVREP